MLIFNKPNNSPRGFKTLGGLKTFGGLKIRNGEGNFLIGNTKKINPRKIARRHFCNSCLRFCTSVSFIWYPLSIRRIFVPSKQPAGLLCGNKFMIHTNQGQGGSDDGWYDFHKGILRANDTALRVIYTFKPF